MDNSSEETLSHPKSTENIMFIYKKCTPWIILGLCFHTLTIVLHTVSLVAIGWSTFTIGNLDIRLGLWKACVVVNNGTIHLPETCGSDVLSDKSLNTGNFRNLYEQYEQQLGNIHLT